MFFLFDLFIREGWFWSFWYDYSFLDFLLYLFCNFVCSGGIDRLGVGVFCIMYKFMWFNRYLGRFFDFEFRFIFVVWDIWYGEFGFDWEIFNVGRGG